jgi:dTDP-glucose 4,6-dehydratase
MNILITGGAGFIGSNLIHYLLEDAKAETDVEITRVVNLDKLTYAGNLTNLKSCESDPRYEFIEGDIKDADLLKDLFDKYEFDAVLHLAAESHVDRSIDAPEEFVMTNVIGTFRLLEAARCYFNELKEGKDFRFLHISTDEVYGSLSATDPAFCETTAYQPNSPYSASKASSDHFVRAYHHTYNLPVITTNCSNNYGPYQFPEKLIPLIIQKALNGEDLPVYGDGTNVRDWLYVKDHCRGLFLSLIKGRFGETYNIGGKNEEQNITVVSTILSILRDLGHPQASDDLIKFVTDRPGHDRRYAINCDKIETELGWSPQENFASGLQKTIEWYLANTHWTESIKDGSYRGERLGTLTTA